jgi:hypothetical protein
MKNNSVAQRLRAIALGGKPSMEDNGEGRVSATLQAPETTVATGEAPGEDKDLTTKIVEVKEGHDVEVADTERTDNVPMVGAEVEDGKASAVEGADISKKDLAPVVSTEDAGDVSATLKPVDETPADGEGAPGEDQNLSTTVVETGSMQPVESAETQVSGNVEEAETEVSQEAFSGGVLGFILGSFGGVYGGFANGAAESKKKEILKVAEQIKLIRREGLAAAKKDGKKISTQEEDSLANADTGKIIKGVLLGMVGFNIYGAYVGSKLQNAERDLRKKYQELQELIEDEQAKGARPSQETYNEAISMEGWKGALGGFLAGTTSVWAGAAVGGLAGPIGATGGAIGANVGISVAAKERRERLKDDILKISKALESLRQGDLEQAKKEGKVVPPEQRRRLTPAQVALTAIKGFVPFHTTYQGHKIEELQDELQDKLRELKREFRKAGIDVSNESYDAAEAAALFAEGAMAAAEAAAGAEAGDSAAAEVQEGAVVTDVVADAVQEAGVAEVAGDEAAAEVADASADPAEPISSDDDSDALDGPNEEDAALDEEIAGAEDQIEEEEQNLETFEDAEVSVESLIDTLEAAQQTGGLTPSGAKMFNVALNTVSRSLTGEGLPVGLVPSLESYGGTDTRRNATAISMEAAGDWWQKILEAIRQTFQVLKQWAQKFVKMLFDKSERVLRRAKGVRAKAGQAKGGQIKAGGWASAIAHEGKVDLNGLQVLPGIVDDIAKRGTDGVSGYAAFAEAIKSLAASGDVGERGDAIFSMPDVRKVVANARGPLFKVESSADTKTTDGTVYSTDVLPGNVRFELEVHELNHGKLASSDASFTEGFKGGFKSNQWPKVTKHSVEAERPTEVRGLTSAEVNTVATRVITVVEQVRRVRNQIAEAEKADAAMLQVQAPEGAERAQRLSLWMFVKSAESLRKMIANNQAVMLKYVIGVAEGYVSYAEASVGGAAAEAPAASEAAAAA